MSGTSIIAQIFVPLKHNGAAIELQIGLSSINKQEWDTLVTYKFYHCLATEGGHPTWEEISLKKYHTARSFFLSHTGNLNIQKQQIYISLMNMISFP